MHVRTLPPDILFLFFINCWSSVVASVVLPQLCNLHCPKNFVLPNDANNPYLLLCVRCLGHTLQMVSCLWCDLHDLQRCCHPNNARHVNMLGVHLRSLGIFFCIILLHTSASSPPVIISWKALSAWSRSSFPRFAILT